MPLKKRKIIEAVELKCGQQILARTDKLFATFIGAQLEEILDVLAKGAETHSANISEVRKAHLELAGAAAATKNAKAMHVLGESSTRLGAVMPKQRQVLNLQKEAISRLKSVAKDVLLHHQVVQAAAGGLLDRAVLALAGTAGLYAAKRAETARADRTTSAVTTPSAMRASARDAISILLQSTSSAAATGGAKKRVCVTTERRRRRTNQLPQDLMNGLLAAPWKEPVGEERHNVLDQVLGLIDPPKTGEQLSPTKVLQTFADAPKRYFPCMKETMMYFKWVPYASRNALNSFLANHRGYVCVGFCFVRDEVAPSAHHTCMYARA